MASQSLFTWYDAAITYGSTEFLLAIPLTFSSVSDVKYRRVAESLDRTNREVTTIGAKVEEVDLMIRHDDDPGRNASPDLD